MTDNDQLISQARAIHAKAMNYSDLASEGAWTARETVNGLPPNNYWAVTATRTPTAKGVESFTVWKAHVNTPAVAALMTFVSTALPQLCDLIERLQGERAEALKTIEGLGRLGELVTAFVDPSGVLDVTGLKNRIVALEQERDEIAQKAREWAAHYSEASDGRNTFVMFAEWVEARK